MHRMIIIEKLYIFVRNFSFKIVFYYDYAQNILLFPLILACLLPVSSLVVLNVTCAPIGWSWIDVDVRHMADRMVGPSTGAGDQPARVNLHHSLRHLNGCDT